MEGRSNKSKLIIGIVLLVLGVGLLVWALTGRNADAPSSESTTPSGSSQQTSVENPDESVSTSSDQSQTATVVFTNDGFSPSTLTVTKGTVVTVKNDSSSRVQFSSDDHPTHRLNTEMNLSVLEPGESASFMAETVGSHGFHDHIDDRYTGTLTVTE